MATPLADAVVAARAAGLKPLQIPGHKYRYLEGSPGGVIGFDLLRSLIRDDIPLQGAADDNHFTNGWLEQAQALYAKAIGADGTRFLVNGGSQGNMSALLTVGGDNKRIACDRTSHRSALTGLVLSGTTPVWIFPDRHPEFGIPTGLPASSLKGINSVVGVFATSPSYVGTMTKVRELADAAHEIDAPLIVDQAWGAHFDFNVPGHPSALAQGADMVITSIHKALMGYTQTALISFKRERISETDLNWAVNTTMTTSPSGTLLASIDATREAMELEGAAALSESMEACANARRILQQVPGLVVLDDANADCEIDPLKLVLWLPHTGTYGTDLAKQLWQMGIGIESADHDTLIMTVCVTDTIAEIQTIAEMLARLIESNRGDRREAAPAKVWGIKPEVAMTPRAASFADMEVVPLAKAVGRIATEQFTPYPPGVPLIGPGEVVTDEIIEAIAIAGKTGRVAYCSDPTLQTIHVVA